MDTKAKIKAALLRIEKGRPKSVSASRKLSIASVAEEAGISPSTIINRHPELADVIRDKAGIKKRTLSGCDEKVKELESKLAAANREIKALKHQLAVAISKQATKALTEV